MSKILEAVTEKIGGIVEALGYDILDIEYGKKPAGYNLTVTIDREGGIFIDDCEKVHRAIDGPLDELEGLFPDGYFLNVSSPGLDRPLKNQKDFRRNAGKQIEVKFYAPENGKKSINGTLLSYDEKTFTILTESGELSIDIKKPANITPIIDFKELYDKAGSKGEKDD